MDFDTWIGRAWDAHASDTDGVAATLIGEGLPLASSDDHRLALARLAKHVHGEHLGRWADGRATLARIGAGMAGPAAATLKVLDASLGLAEGTDDPRTGMSASERVRVTAMAASALGEHDTARAAALLHEALADAETAGLADDDLAVRALAITGNSLAGTLEEKPTRTEAERELMILAARTSRTCWARAGTWLETERADYRLAMTWLQAGDAAEARRHAQACLAIVRENDAPALEHFFAWEALGAVERAAGNTTGHAQAVAQAREAFARLDAADVEWCRPSLDKLAG